MSPTPQIIALIRSHVSDWSPTDAAIADALNTANIANPVAQGQVPVVLSEDALGTLLTDPSNGSVAKLVNWPNYGLLQTDILADNHGRVLAWGMKLAGVGIIAVDEAQSIAAYVQSTVPDPSWKPQISWAQSALLRVVDIWDIAASRPGA